MLGYLSTMLNRLLAELRAVLDADVAAAAQALAPRCPSSSPPSRDLGLIACQWIISNRMCRDPGGL